MGTRKKKRGELLVVGVRKKMMRMKTKAGSGSSPASNGEVDRREVQWELRPGGMLVQTRNQEGVEASVPAPPTIKVRVKHGSTLHEVAISSQATFGTAFQSPLDALFHLPIFRVAAIL